MLGSCETEDGARVDLDEAWVAEGWLAGGWLAGGWLSEAWEAAVGRLEAGVGVVAGIFGDEELSGGRAKGELGFLF